MKEVIIETSGRIIETEQKRSPSMLDKLAGLFLFAVLFVFPLLFGGVHEPCFISFFITAIVICVLLLIYRRSPYFEIFRDSSATRPVLILFSSIVAYGIAQYLVLSEQRVPHPVLTTASSLGSRDDYFSASSRIVFFFATFLVARLFVARPKLRAAVMYFLIATSGVCMAAVGLIHWFYDNGLLFWTFAPETVVVTSRARWPFVNPNHLADFLLLAGFPAVALLRLKLAALEDSFEEQASRKGARLAEVVSHHRVQNQFLRVSFAAAFVTIISVCIAATLSRGGWLGAGCGLFLFATLLPERSAASARYMQLSDPDGDGGRRQKRRRHRRNELRQLLHALSPIRRYVVPLLLLAGVLFLLQGKGAELVEERMEYGLLYAKSDMRWQLYRDTLPLIREHLWFGVGAGNWEGAFLRHMDPLLAGVNPEYLHSDPLQLLAEFGLFGAVPYAGLFFVVIWKLLLVLRRNVSFELKIRVMGLATGMLAFVVSSFVEFPFRLPAIAALLAINLALFCELVDEAVKE